MADGSKIEWTNATWNPITGCSVVSPGCTNCYAMKLAGTRMKHHPSREGLTDDTKAGPVWNGRLRFNREWLDQPLRWKRKRMIFVCAHGDLFHEDVPLEWLYDIWMTMSAAHREHGHIFQVLTKRPERMRGALGPKGIGWYAVERPVPNPEPGIWLGTSVEDAERIGRLDELERTPAALRFASLEPLLGPLAVDRYLSAPPPLHLASTHVDEGGVERADLTGQPLRGLDWVIVGGESGPRARPMHPNWATDIRDQCADAVVPFFFKQWGEWAPGTVILDAEGALDGRLPHHDWGDDRVSYRAGKKRAGRKLDGRTWDGMPELGEEASR